VLLLRLRYYEHEIGDALPPEKFSVLPASSLPLLVSSLLERRSYWVAESVLEICFRRPHTQKPIELLEIWSSIAWFIGMPDSGDNEYQSWTRAAMMHTFHEGCLRRGLTSEVLEPPGLSKWSWEEGIAMLSRHADQIRLQSGPNCWEKSRASMRQELISLDKAVWNAAEAEEPWMQDQIWKALQELGERARQNNDMRLQSGVQWRGEVFGNGKDPDSLTRPTGLVSGVMYKAYQVLREQQTRAKGDGKPGSDKPSGGKPVGGKPVGGEPDGGRPGVKKAKGGHLVNPAISGKDSGDEVGFV